MLGKRGRGSNSTEDEFGIEAQVTVIEDDELNEEKSRFKLRHIISIGILIMVIVAVTMVKYGESERMKSELKQKTEHEMYVAERTSEPHSSLAYYLEEGDVEQRIESAARLIGHSMATGCSRSYDSLRDNFKDESLVHVQDYLTGRECEEYVKPSVVRLSQDYERYEYLLTIKGERDRYVITIAHNNEKPVGFKVSLYEKKNLTDKEGNK